VIHGELDMAIGLDPGKARAEELPKAQLAVIKGGGHAADLTHPNQVNPHLEKFLVGLH
jgi:pimeloyl-ACP methyl ester carboxylesterase